VRVQAVVEAKAGPGTIEPTKALPTPVKHRARVPRRRPAGLAELDSSASDISEGEAAKEESLMLRKNIESMEVELAGKEAMLVELRAQITCSKQSEVSLRDKLSNLESLLRANRTDLGRKDTIIKGKAVGDPIGRCITQI
jgi:hypothetical protein